MEQPVQFGNRQRLFGVAGMPETVSGPALVLSNAGSLSRIGPNRLWVQLTRAANASGLPTLRFDQSGFGDSPVSEIAQPINFRRLEEYRDAIDFITIESGARSVVIVGLCSGAIDAHDVAVTDPRVIANVMVDGYADRTRGFHRRRLFDYAMSPKRWKSAPKILRGLIAPPTSEPLSESDALSMNFPDRDRVIDEFRMLVERRFRSLMIYTGSWTSLVNSPRQLFEAFPEVEFSGLFDVELWPTVNHTFTIDMHRARFVSRVLGWFREVNIHESQ